MSVTADVGWPKPEGWTWQAVADELGVTADTLYKWRHPEKFRAIARRDNARRAEAKRAWNRQNYWRAYQDLCPTCGHPKRKTSRQCRDCRRGWRY